MGAAAAAAGALGGGAFEAIASRPSRRDLADLASAIEGKVVLPRSPGYQAARLIWNSRYDDERPAAVVKVASADDVRTVVEFARDHGTRLVPRGGAHSFAGYSTGSGLVLDTSAIRQLQIDGVRERARLGAGTTLLPVYRALWEQRMAISGGTCPTVGTTGLTAGGGLGVLSRRHGLTCDTLLEVETVTADGRLVRANESENADLYWATRGGGGGNFGVITALTFGLVPVDMPFTHAEYEFPWSAAESVLTAWQDWLPGSPQATWSAAELLTQAPGDADTPTVALEVVHAGPREELDAIVADLLGAIGVEPSAMDAESGPFIQVEGDFYCRALRPKECEIERKSPRGMFPRPSLYSKSDVAKGPWPREGILTLIDWMERRQRDPVLTPAEFSPAHTIGKVLIEAADGAVNSLAPDATAFVHRDNLFVAQYQARWRKNSPPDTVAANLRWANDFYAAVEPYRSGSAYQDYIDPELEDWERAYYGANLDRLRAVKSKYDPKNFFRFAQSIPPA